VRRRRSIVAGKEAPVVTPWEVKGEIDYDRLMERFGTEPITPELLERIKRHTGRLHHMLRRGVFYSHRDLDAILDHYEGGGRFVLYTGRGPSGPVHLGHLVPWTFTRHLQKIFGSKLFFQFTDDERMLIRDDIDEEGHGLYVDCLEGGIDCRECHARLAETVNRFRGRHHRRRRLIRGGVEKMLE